MLPVKQPNLTRKCPVTDIPTGLMAALVTRPFYRASMDLLSQLVDLVLLSQQIGEPTGGCGIARVGHCMQLVDFALPNQQLNQRPGMRGVVGIGGRAQQSHSFPDLALRLQQPDQYTSVA